MVQLTTGNIIAMVLGPIVLLAILAMTITLIVLCTCPKCDCCSKEKLRYIEVNEGFTDDENDYLV